MRWTDGCSWDGRGVAGEMAPGRMSGRCHDSSRQRSRWAYRSRSRPRRRGHAWTATARSVFNALLAPHRSKAPVSAARRQRKPHRLPLPYGRCTTPVLPRLCNPVLRGSALPSRWLGCQCAVSGSAAGGPRNRIMCGKGPGMARRQARARKPGAIVGRTCLTGRAGRTLDTTVEWASCRGMQGLRLSPQGDARLRREAKSAAADA
jgi:hypothetical protein